MITLERLQKTLGYHFNNISILETALTHRSASSKHNERLEYLGDAILNFVIAEALYQRYPKSDEGELSRMRANLVKKETLAVIARELDLGEYLHLGSGELKSGGYRRESILADTVEAIIAGIYLDSDMLQVKNRILSWFTTLLAEVIHTLSDKDQKTQLQEYLQSRKLALPTYEIIRTEGKDHNQIFYVRCQLTEPAFETTGHGSSRRRAEQMAAELLLEELTHV